MIDIMTQSLNDLQWSKSNSMKRTVLNIAEGDHKEPDRYSFITGLIRDWLPCAHNNYTQSLRLSSSSKLKKHQMLMCLASMYIKEYYPDFKYTSIQFSKCMLCPRHVDKNNVGESVIVAFGDYTSGGGLIIYDEDGHEHVHDIFHKPLVFNASQQYHRTQDFVGTRYSITWFSMKGFD
tara:strand:+ start:857 stop:1390 length:534 start_codon:yes stop_codon:yes gene_type:complete